MRTLAQASKPNVEPHGDAVRARIIGAAFKAFTESGYAGTSTLEIATRAKISKKTLYSHFREKHAILVACIAERAQRMRPTTNLPVPQDRAMLAATLETFGAVILREVSHPHVMAVFRLAIAEAIRSPKVARTLHAAGRQPTRAALSELLARAQERGVIGSGDANEMAMEFLALLWSDLMVDLLLRIADAPQPGEIERRVAKATAAFLQLHPEPVP